MPEDDARNLQLNNFNFFSKLETRWRFFVFVRGMSRYLVLMLINLNKIVAVYRKQWST